MDIKVSMSDEIIKVLDYIFEKFGVVVDWSNGEVLPYLQSLAEKVVKYEASLAKLWIGIGIAAVVVGIILLIINAVSIDEGFVTFVAIVVMAFGVFVGIKNTEKLITCNTFPEKIVFEYIQDTWNEIENSSSLNTR